jgi:predicted PurR-regulated permease PerM
MKLTNTPLGTINFKRRRSSTVTKIVVLVAVVLSIVALLMFHFAIVSARDTAEDLRQEAIGLEQEQSRLEWYIQELGTIQGIIRLAQEKLGLIEPGSVIIQTE